MFLEGSPECDTCHRLDGLLKRLKCEFCTNICHNRNVCSKIPTRVSKEESWKELLEEAVTNIDQRKMLGIIKSMNGTPDSNSPNEVLIYS